jgi:putrescine aminotransferase
MADKEQIIKDFAAYSQPAKAEIWQRYGMDLVLGRREGPYVWDIEGGEPRINLHINGGTYNLGHRNPEIIATLKEALDDLELDIGNGHLISQYRAQTAKKLAELMPGDLTYSIFNVSGGEAVDCALKVARGYTKRMKIISANGGYHGHTGLAMFTGDAKYRDLFMPQPPGYQQVPYADIAALEEAIDDDTAAVIMETIPATLGMPIPPAEYFPKVRELCDQRGALLILDEVQTGFGRTGKLWAFEHYEIVPDIVVLAKGTSGGIYPISATVLREPLIHIFDDDPFAHVSTFGGAELGCRVLLKVLEISSAPEFLDHVNTLATAFAEGVEKLRRKHSDFLVRLRQLGLFMGLEFIDDWSGPLVTSTSYHQGLWMIWANNDKRVMQFLPPLNIELALVDEIMEKLDVALLAAKQLKGMA